jgi:hypothetical protein
LKAKYLKGGEGKCERKGRGLRKDKWKEKGTRQSMRKKSMHPDERRASWNRMYQSADRRRSKALWSAVSRSEKREM